MSPTSSTEESLERLPGRRAIGHTRYSTSGDSVLTNAQPIVVKTSMGPLALVHNGNLVNAGELRRQLERQGSIFQTTSDTEVILHLMARNPRDERGGVADGGAGAGAGRLLAAADDRLAA